MKNKIKNDIILIKVGWWKNDLILSKIFLQLAIKYGLSNNTLNND